MSAKGMFRLHDLKGTCCIDGCGSPSTKYAVAVDWIDQDVSTYEWCDTHASEVYQDLLDAKATAEGDKIH